MLKILGYSVIEGYHYFLEKERPATKQLRWLVYISILLLLAPVSEDPARKVLTWTLMLVNKEEQVLKIIKEGNRTKSRTAIPPFRKAGFRLFCAWKNPMG